MSTHAEIRLWGNRIAVVSMDANDAAARFEYAHDFLKSGIEPSPIVMPLAERVYRFPELSEASF
ncbi:MAG TPA: HipA N-terminal domain-containing protein, partial [Opitutales bacterium]|nr:HipA N-terminal domain-containing protein [Opitutales bacterium]